MSGGVDSTIAAYLLKKSGYETIGINMRLEGESKKWGILNDLKDIHLIARKLSIPLYVLDVEKEFEKEVVEYFCREYLDGRTPNPCIICNQKIKFGIMLEKAKELGASLFATGHYAGIEYNPSTQRYCLKKGQKSRKEQSYFLFSLSQKQLSSSIFPLSHLTKEEVRQLATNAELISHTKKESQEVCFISQKSYNEFLKKRGSSSLKPGSIVDKNGRVVGEHCGVHSFTIGQRKGLSGGRKNPVYVTEIKKEENIIVVGEREDIYAKSMQVSKVNWVSIAKLEKPLCAKVKIRYQHPEAKAIIHPLSEKEYRVDFSHPQWAISPGQATVFYQGDTLLGGGWIKKVIR